jgi:hypothetical protein
MKLGSCVVNTMLCPDDLAVCLPGPVRDVVVLLNMCSLSLAVEREHPEDFIEQLAKALPEDMNFLSRSDTNLLQRYNHNKEGKTRTNCIRSAKRKQNSSIFVEQH